MWRVANRRTVKVVIHVALKAEDKIKALGQILIFLAKYYSNVSKW